MSNPPSSDRCAWNVEVRVLLDNVRVLPGTQGSHVKSGQKEQTCDYCFRVDNVAANHTVFNRFTGRPAPPPLPSLLVGSGQGEAAKMIAHCHPEREVLGGDNNRNHCIVC